MSLGGGVQTVDFKQLKLDSFRLQKHMLLAMLVLDSGLQNSDATLGICTTVLHS